MKFQLNQLSKEEILFLLQKVDPHFVPFPLSKKVDLKLYSEKLAKYAVHFSVEDNNRLIGMTCCYLNHPEKGIAYTSITCIDPDYFGLGLGKKLTHNCEEYARISGFKFVEFEVHIDNKPSIEMHKTIGYYINRQENESFYMRKVL